MIEIELAVVLTLGFTLGLVHATDADHVVAISTILSENKSLKKTSVLGAFWGLGHTITLLFAGLVVLLLAVSIPQSLALFFEFMVGLVLIALGLSVIRKTLGRSKHIHSHLHDDKMHTHFHDHSKTRNHEHEHKSFIVGMFHGLAGSSALMLLTLSSIDSILEGFAFILIFGLGSILGMLIIGTLIGLPFALTSIRSGKWNIRIRLIAGSLSIALGFMIVYQISIVEGLLF